MSLELRVPPVVLLVLSGAAMWSFARFLPALNLGHAPRWLVLLPGIVGIAVALAGIVAFRRARTTVDPTHPEKSSAIVTGGIYRWSRNPMYLGFLLILLAWAIRSGNAASALLLPAFVLYMNRFQIAPEERILEGKFGSAYVEYARRVRRWI